MEAEEEAIHALNDEAAELLNEEKLEAASKKLKLAEKKIETLFSSSAIAINKRLLIVVLHNLACYYQKTKEYSECVSYLEAVIFHFQNLLGFDFEQMKGGNLNFDQLGDVILQLRFCAKFNLQLCAVLSQLGKHKESLSISTKACILCEDNIEKSFALLKKQKSSASLKEAEKVLFSLCQKISKFKKIASEKKQLEIIYSQAKESKEFMEKEEIKRSLVSMFGARNEQDWINFLNIGNIMYLSPISLEDLDLDSEAKNELLRDALIEKIVMLTVSYFCLATELKFMENEERSSEFWHAKAVEIACLYLPSSCPLIKHFFSTYNRYFNNEFKPVPENELVDFHLEMHKTHEKAENLFLLRMIKQSFVPKKSEPKRLFHTLFNSKIAEKQRPFTERTASNFVPERQKEKQSKEKKGKASFKLPLSKIKGLRPKESKKEEEKIGLKALVGFKPKMESAVLVYRQLANKKPVNAEFVKRK